MTLPRLEPKVGAPTPATAGLPPWMLPAWDRLNRARTSNRLPHALLVAGPRGVGKRLLVEQLVRTLLCPGSRADGAACGDCPDCLLMRAGSHPDLVRAGPDLDSKSGEIPIESIRELTDRATLTASRGGPILMVIDPADRMTTGAANALLKTLEEPPGPVLLCLVVEQPGRLPATVRSRCQMVTQGLPPRGEAAQWLVAQVQPPADESAIERALDLARGAPLRALDVLGSSLWDQHERLREGFLGLARGDRDPVAEAAAWSGVGARLSLDWFAGWLCDLLRLAAQGEGASLDRGDSQVLAELVPRIDQAATHRLLRRTFQGVRLTDSTANPQLLLESLLVEWSGLFPR